MTAVDTDRERYGVDAVEASRALAEDLVLIVRDASDIDLRSFEERGGAALHRELLPRVHALVERSLEVMDRALALHEDSELPEEGLEEGPGSFLLRIDRAVGTRGRSAHVADLAFMARLELRNVAHALQGFGPGSDLWRMLGTCDSCLRGLRKAASAVERALAEHAGFEPRLEFVTELHIGRVVRAYYARFRREIEGDGPPTAATVHRRLLSGAASIAKLIGRDFYGDLRVDDRAQLRSLQERLREWLMGTDDHAPASGIRLWQDLHGFTILLAQINRRSELVEHDRALVETALRELNGKGELPEQVPPDLFHRLDRLRGRTDRIDQLLAEPTTRATGAWLTELQRLRERLAFAMKSTSH